MLMSKAEKIGINISRAHLPYLLFLYLTSSTPPCFSPYSSSPQLTQHLLVHILSSSLTPPLLLSSLSLHSASLPCNSLSSTPPHLQSSPLLPQSLASFYSTLQSTPLIFSLSTPHLLLAPLLILLHHSSLYSQLWSSDILTPLFSSSSHHSSPWSITPCSSLVIFWVCQVHPKWPQVVLLPSSLLLRSFRTPSMLEPHSWLLFDTNSSATPCSSPQWVSTPLLALFSSPKSVDYWGGGWLRNGDQNKEWEMGALHKKMTDEWIIFLHMAAIQNLPIPWRSSALDSYSCLLSLSLICCIVHIWFVTKTKAGG